MLLDIETFRRRTEYELDSLVDELERKTKRATPAERAAWRNSLPTFARALSHDALKGFHIRVGHTAATPSAAGEMVLEYRLPSSPSWADVVLLGGGPSGPAAVVVELKDWDLKGDAPGERESLVQHHNRETLHPSDQVRGYTEYCQRFHSAVQEHSATVHGCVFFTYASNADAYQSEPHRALVDAFPVFTRSELDVRTRFPEYLSKRLVKPDVDFARQFDVGTYKQDRGFVLQVSEAIRRPTTSPFVLLDQQREGYEHCVQQIERRLKPAKASAKSHDNRSVIVIHGPPGSGKSVIAAHLWATLGADPHIDGNVVLTSTSTAQRTNWEKMFERVSGKRAAKGIVIGSNQYNPGLNQVWLKRQRESGNATLIADWKTNVATYKQEHARLKCPDFAFAISIVDEAHALIDPTALGKAGMSAAGWQLHAGPQAWHVIRASRVSVFLLDPEQSYRDNETTTLQRIRDFAADFDAEVTEISLAGSQFRCGGSVEYMNWLEDVLSPKPAARRASTTASSLAWRGNQVGSFEFEVVDDPQQLEDSLRPHIARGRSARLLASYARKWKTQHALHPHRLPVVDQDFVIPYHRGAEARTWSRVWNYAPDQDYSVFIQAPKGSATAADPLCEVGCPYVVRGFDFDYVGLLWLSDLVWRRDRWHVDLGHVHEVAWRLGVAAVKRGTPGAEERLVQQLLRGYRILMSRAIRGTYVWFEDEETRDHMHLLLRRK